MLIASLKSEAVAPPRIPNSQSYSATAFPSLPFLSQPHKTMQPSLAILFLPSSLPRGQIPLLRVLLTRVLPFTVMLSAASPSVRPSVGGECGGRDRGRQTRKPTTDPAASIVLGDDGNGAKG